LWKALAAQLEVVRDDVDAIDVAAVDRVVASLGAGLRWEVGPASDGGLMFAFSCGLDEDRLRQADTVVRRAPPLKGWRFLAGRPARAWSRMVAVGRGSSERTLDLRHWEYGVVRYPDEKLGVTFVGSELREFSDTDRFVAGEVLLVSELGERFAARWIAEFEVVDVSSYDGRLALTEVTHLRAHMGSLTGEAPEPLGDADTEGLTRASDPSGR
jgi:hypothetical protein